MRVARYERVAGVVWRLGPDRVLVRRVRPAVEPGVHTAGGAGDECADLLGSAALVWVAMDLPATVDELADRLAAEQLDLPSNDLADVVAQLVAADWVRATEPTSG